MSEHHYTDTEQERSTTHSHRQTDVEDNESYVTNESAGMSTPLPNPPHEKVAVEVGVAHFANPGVPHLQLKSPSADRPAMGHNTSQLPDIEQPPRVVADTEPGQGIVQYEQYGAWSSSLP